jgi:hypothetical protein
MMRGTFTTAELIIVIAIGLYWWQSQTRRPALSIFPTGQPRFTVYGKAPQSHTNVSFAVAITNNTRSMLRVSVEMALIQVGRIVQQ